MNFEFSKLAANLKGEYGYFLKKIAEEYTLIPINTNTIFEDNYIALCLVGRFDIPNDLFHVFDKNKDIKARKRICIVDEAPIYVPALFVKNHILENYFDIIYRCLASGCDNVKSFLYLTIQRRYLWADPKTGMNALPIPKNFHISKNRSDKILVLLNNKYRTNEWQNRPSQIEINGEIIPNLLKFRYDVGKWLDTNLPVDLYGDYWKNFKNAKGIYLGNRWNLYRNYKFCFTCENCICDNYVADRLFDVIGSGCIPIYLGGTQVNRMLPKDIFVNIANFKGDYIKVFEYAFDMGYEYFYNNICENIEKLEEKIETRKYVYDLLKLGIEGDATKIIKYMEDKLWWNKKSHLISY